MIPGFDELRRSNDHLRSDILGRALRAAEDAAAEVIRKAVEAAAPRKSGQLAKSIIVYESTDRRALTGSARQRLLVGPGKKKGFYGFFLAKGWRSGGRRRLARKASGNTHSQSGSSTYRDISAPYPDWMSQITTAVETRAYEAGLKAFQAVIDRETSRMR